MGRPQILDDTFEKIAELGSQTAKQTKKAGQAIVKKAVNELSGGNIFEEKRPSTGESPAANHSELDPQQLDRLNKIYAHKKEDNEEMTKVKERLNFFQEFKQEERKTIEEIKREEEERKRQEEEELQKKKDEEKQQGLETVTAPKGKVRRNIFQRAVKSSQPETRVGGGK